MRKTVPLALGMARVRDGEMASNDSDGMAGFFFIVHPAGGELRIVSSGVDHVYGWEHVSVSLENRVPTWREMCFVKALFWDDEEAVMQLHPPQSEYVNHHPNCLHLWRPLAGISPLPPSLLVGPKGAIGAKTAR